MDKVLPTSIKHRLNPPKGQKREDIKALITRIAIEEGIDPPIALALALQESNFDHTAVGDNGRSTGLFQINSDAHRKYKRLDNPEYQTRYALGLLKDLLKRHNGNLYNAIRSYNGSGKMATEYANKYFSTNLPVFDKQKKYTTGSRIAKEAYNTNSGADINKLTGNVIDNYTFADRTAAMLGIDRYVTNKYGSKGFFDASSMSVLDRDGKVLEDVSEMLNSKTAAPNSITANDAANYVASSNLRKAGLEVTPENIEAERLQMVQNEISNQRNPFDFNATNPYTAPTLNAQKEQFAEQINLGNFNNDYEHLDAVSRFTNSDPAAYHIDLAKNLPVQVDEYINNYLNGINNTRS